LRKNGWLRKNGTATMMVGNYTQRQGKKWMAEKKEKKGAKLTDEGNRTQISKIKRDHLTTTLRLLS